MASVGTQNCLKSPSNPHLGLGSFLWRARGCPCRIIHPVLREQETEAKRGVLSRRGQRGGEGRDATGDPGVRGAGRTPVLRCGGEAS